eukprot:3026849-Alexandrium_andersonii.AAC.1
MARLGGHVSTSHSVLDLGARRSFGPSLGTVGREEGFGMHGNCVAGQHGAQQPLARVGSRPELC